MKLVCKDHPRDQQNVVLIDRWSLYAGSIAREIYTPGPVKCGFRSRRSLYTGGL